MLYRFFHNNILNSSNTARPKRSMFFFKFWTKGYKIVEILALLTTELSSSKEYNVAIDMLFCFLRALIFNVTLFLNLFLGGGGGGGGRDTELIFPIYCEQLS